MPHKNHDELMLKLDKAYDQHLATLQVHQIKIDHYDRIMAKWKRFNSFLNAGTIMSILFIIITSFSEFAAYQATANAITLICVMAAIIYMSAISYYNYRIGRIYKKMTLFMQESMKKIDEEIMSNFDLE